MASEVALVTTAWLRERERGSRHIDVLNAFLLYHLSIGIDLIFVFFDGDETQQPVSSDLDTRLQDHIAHGRIELYYRDLTGHSTHRSTTGTTLQYAQCLCYDRLRGSVDNDVSSRQMIHAELAMKRCQQLNTNGDHSIQWLLHLDIDELLYLPAMASCSTENRSHSVVLHEFVQSLETEGIDQFTIVNHEAVPTTRYGGNYFTTATKFRRHTASIPFSGSSQDALRWWQQRSPHGQFFLFYDNGKSIVRVPPVDQHVVPASVHHWKPSHHRVWKSVSNFYDLRRQGKTVKDPRVCILHYPVCGLEWLTDKYERLGAFESVWGGTTIPIQPCFHLQARDASLQTNEQVMEELYEAQVRADGSDTAFWTMQCGAGVCEEITFPRDLLVRLGFTGTSTEGAKTVPSQPVSSTANNVRQVKAQPPSSYSVETAWLLASITDKYLS